MLARMVSRFGDWLHEKLCPCTVGWDSESPAPGENPERFDDPEVPAFFRPGERFEPEPCTADRWCRRDAPDDSE